MNLTPNVKNDVFDGFLELFSVRSIVVIVVYIFFFIEVHSDLLTNFLLALPNSYTFFSMSFKNFQAVILHPFILFHLINSNT